MTLEAGTEQEAKVVVAVREARSRTRDADVIDGVKKAVADELSLDAPMGWGVG